MTGRIPYYSLESQYCLLILCICGRFWGKIGEFGRNRPKNITLVATADLIWIQIHFLGWCASLFLCGCPNQEIGQTFLFKGHKIGTSSYFGADSATKKITGEQCKANVPLACPHHYRKHTLIPLFPGFSCFFFISCHSNDSEYCSIGALLLSQRVLLKFALLSQRVLLKFCSPLTASAPRFRFVLLSSHSECS